MKTRVLILLIAMSCCKLFALEVVVQDLEPEQISASQLNNTLIDTAIAQVVAAGGGTVIIPDGKYYIHGLTLNGNNVTLKGSGHTVLAAIGNYDAIVAGANAATMYDRKSDITIESLEISMEALNNANNTGTGIKANCVDELQIKNVTVKNGSTGIDLGHSYNVSILHCKCIEQSGKGLRIGPASDKTYVLRGQYGNGNVGIEIEGGYAITIIGASIERNQSYAIDIIPSIGSTGNDNRTEYPGGINITGNYFERNCQSSGDAFIRFGLYNSTINDYAKGINVIGNYFNWDVGNPRTPVVPFYKFDKCANVVIQSNRYNNSFYYAEKTSNTNWTSVISVNDPSSSGAQSAGLKLKSYQVVN